MLVNDLLPAYEVWPVPQKKRAVQYFTAIEITGNTPLSVPEIISELDTEGVVAHYVAE